ncbi:porin family protein [Vibrio methylphosphonaticus]|uniref:porin family protein n=1 Tax=Vibrio methylphosphonaticus TaxID=2946866 RepID=UPI00202AB1E3|nr:porin family protein [Vibrio methylphosphonaticus]MCL9774545.1 porin family protein [Vibrio methylphosphonaticus]
MTTFNTQPKRATLPLRATLFAAALLTPMLASASGAYVGAQLGYGPQKSEFTDFIKENNKDLNTGIGAIKAGYDFNEYFGIEARLSGTDSHTSSIQSNYQTSAYLKGMYPVTESISLYGLIGVTSTQIEYDDINKKHQKDMLNSASYGLGARYAATQNIGINLELNQISSHKDYELNGLFLGVDYKF